MEQLKQQLKELSELALLGAISNPTISKSSTYWHIDHTLRVINGITQALTESDPALFKPQFKMVKLIVMTFKKIPRGKGRAPKHVIPEENISENDLLQKIESGAQGLENLKELSSNHYFNHPLFGHLNLNESIKFQGIHTEHHLKIVREIIQKQ